MSNWFRFLIYSVTGVLSFVVFLFAFFPVQPLIDNFLSSLQNETQGYRFSIEKTHPSLLFKTLFEGIKIETPEGATIFDFSEARVGVQYLPLFSEKYTGSFNAEARKQGEVSGNFYIDSVTRDFDVELDKLGLDGLSSMMAPFRIQGKLSGKINLSLKLTDKKKPAEGEIDLNLLDAKILETEFPSPFGKIPLPLFNLTTSKGAAIKIKFKDGKANFDNVQLTSADLTLILTGNITLNPEWDKSRLNLSGTLKFSEEFETKLAESVAKAFPILNVEAIKENLKTQKNEEGAFLLSISGNPSKPKIKAGTYQLYPPAGAGDEEKPEKRTPKIRNKPPLGKQEKVKEVIEEVKPEGESD